MTLTMARLPTKVDNWPIGIVSAIISCVFAKKLSRSSCTDEISPIRNEAMSANLSIRLANKAPRRATISSPCELLERYPIHPSQSSARSAPFSPDSTTSSHFTSVRIRETKTCYSDKCFPPTTMPALIGTEESQGQVIFSNIFIRPV